MGVLVAVGNGVRGITVTPGRGVCSGKLPTSV
jgi:hypothetical protein